MSVYLVDEFRRAFRELSRGLRLAALRYATDRERLRLRLAEVNRERSRIDVVADRVCDYPANWSLSLRLRLALHDVGMRVELRK